MKWWKKFWVLGLIGLPYLMVLSEFGAVVNVVNGNSYAFLAPDIKAWVFGITLTAAGIILLISPFGDD